MTPRQRLVAKVGAAAAAAVLVVVPQFEGTLFRTYRDPIGILTSCTGHTGPELAMGQKWTPAQCQAQLEADLLKHAADLDCVKVPMTSGQTAALLSFTFNVGRGQFCGSTLVKHANAGNWPAACAQLSRWTYAGGKELPGLVSRRKVERAMCEG